MEANQRSSLYESTAFPVAACPVCHKHTLVAQDLDDEDRWVLACAQCGHVHGREGEVRTLELSASVLSFYGYDVENELPAAGCGEGEGGGCSSCGSGCG